MNINSLFRRFDELVDAPERIPALRKVILACLLHSAVNSPDAVSLSATLREAHESRRRELARSFSPKAVPTVPDVVDTDLPLSLSDIPIPLFDCLGAIATVEKGLSQIQSTKPGPYPLVVTAESRSSSDTYDFEGAAAIVPLVSSTGHGDASLKRLHYQEGRYAVGNILAVIRPICPDLIRARFLYEYLSAFKEELLVSRMVGTANVSLTVNKLKEVPVPLVSGPVLARIDELMALCDQLEAQQQERETRKSVLVRASLARFAETPTPSNLGFLFHKSYDIPPAELRKTILTLAVQGRLVPQDPHDNDTTSDCSRLTQLVAEGLHTLPASWRWCRVEDVGEVKLGRQRAPQYHKGPYMRPYLRVQNVYEARIDTSDVKEMNFTPEEYDSFALRRGDILLNEGQSRELVGRPAIYGDEVPGACFQNTLIRFRTRGNVDPAFGLVVFRACMHNGRFQQISQQTTNIAHLSAGRFAKMEFPLPPLAEQRRIVAKVDQLMSLVDELERQQELSRTTASKLLDAIVHELTGTR